MPFTLAALCTALTISACSTPDPPRMLTPYFEDDFRFWTGTGPSNLEGTINTKLDNGQVVTCAGSSVTLMPATAYNMELEGYIEQGKGYPADYSRRARQFNRTVACDSNGHFFVRNLPEIKWIVATHVSWSEGSSIPGVTSILGESSKGAWIFQEKTLTGGANTLNLGKDDLVRETN